MIITTYIDLGNAGVLNEDDLQLASKLDSFSGSNLMMYLKKNINGLQNLTRVDIRNAADHTAMVTLHAPVSLVSKSSRIEEAIIRWFSPSRMGLSNRKIRYFKVNGKEDYVNTITIVID